MRETTHNHIDGSLPLDFLRKKIAEHPQIPDSLLASWQKIFAVDHQTITTQQYSEKIKATFTSDSQENLKTLFALYSLLRKLVQTRYEQEKGSIYAEGSYYYESSYAIAQELLGQDLDRFVLLIGTTNQVQQFIGSLEGVTQGFTLAEQKRGAPPTGFVRLTFSRAADGTIKNCSPDSLRQTLTFLDNDPYLRQRVDGFDFCGHENPQQLEPTLELLEILTKYNQICQQDKTREPYVISIHAGENCYDWTAEDHLNALEQLLNLSWDLVGHGSFLWLPNRVLDITAAEDKARRDLLVAYGQSGKRFEICPTSNMLLTPMESSQDFPLQFFIDQGFGFTVNPDDSTLFSTSYDQERRKLGLA